MNKHILLVIKWLNDKESVTQEELMANRKTAYVADAAEKWVNKYFERTGENKQDYIDSLKPVTPTYTQAMCDAGELPPVGSEFIHQNKKVKCISTSDEQGGVVTFLVDELNIECCWNNDSWVRAITPPKTDTEKAIDSVIDKTIAEMERRFELPKINNSSMVSDDTQIGVEFAVEFLRGKLIQLLEVKS